MPITRISGQNIGLGKVGGYYKKIHLLYWQKHKDPGWSTPVNDILE